MSSPATSFNLSQQQINNIALEGISLAQLLGLPIEDHLFQKVKNQATAFSKMLDVKKLPILLCDDGRASWAE